MSPWITSTDEEKLRAEKKQLEDNLVIYKGMVTEGQLKAWRCRKDIVARRIRKLYNG